MTALFGNLKTEGTEKTEDRLGGGFQPLDTDIYTGIIKLAYAGQSSGGARSVTFIMAGGDFGDREYRETIYITNRAGENTYTTAKTGDKKFLLPGYITADHICQVTVGKELNQMAGEEKMVNIYDAEAGKEVPKSVQCLVELHGKEVSVGIVRKTENQTEKDGSGNYVPKADGSTRDVNNIEKVWNTAHRMTVPEARAKQDDANFVPGFWDKWQEKNKGVTRDGTTKGNGQGGAAGRPGGGAPQGGGNAGGQPAARTSLFGS